MGKSTAKEPTTTRMAISILAIGSKIKRMATVCLSIRAGLSMMDSGLMTKRLTKGRSSIQTKINTKGIS